MSLDTSNILASGICHDIISPIGAIHNGLELISMTASTDIKSPEMALINDSCQDARTRVEFFRIAFGTYQQGQMMEASKIQKIANAIYATPRFHLTWEMDPEMDRTWAQILYLGLMSMERQLTLGGSLTVSAKEDHLEIIATSERATVAHPGWERLSSEPGVLPAPAVVQVHRIPNIAGAYGFAVEFNHSETLTTLFFRRG
jgi:histidine phosphotransferase ChpT